MGTRRPRESKSLASPGKHGSPCRLKVRNSKLQGFDKFLNFDQSTGKLWVIAPSRFPIRHDYFQCRLIGGEKSLLRLLDRPNCGLPMLKGVVAKICA